MPRHHPHRSRFDVLKNKLAHRPGVHNPSALAAWIGLKKYGSEAMAHKAQAARHHHHPGHGLRARHHPS